MQTIDYPLVQQAPARLKGQSADAQTRRLAFVQERALLNEATVINAAAATGKLGGKALPEHSRHRLESWADPILDASTLNAVFAEH